MNVSRQVRRAMERSAQKGVGLTINAASGSLSGFKEKTPEPNRGYTDDGSIDPKFFHVLRYEHDDEEVVKRVEADVAITSQTRYPKHENAFKGQVFGGECNRTACHNHDAIWWNMGTNGLYCTACARAGNMPRAKLYILVEQKPKFDEYEQIKRENGYYTMEF